MNTFRPSESSIQSHLTMLQSIIQRMAGNSASCKTWCITLVSAIVVAVADKGHPQLLWIGLLPIPVFAALDIYYLALEKSFRECYNRFVAKAGSGSLSAEDLYCMSLSKHTSAFRWESVLSYSVVGFYLPLVALVALVRFVVP